MTVQPGCVVRIHGRADAPASDALYEVVSVEEDDLRCWVRRWPLARHGSPVFELPLGQVQEALPHRPLPVGGAWADERGSA